MADEHTTSEQAPAGTAAEDALLRALTHMLRAGERPNSAQELLARAQEEEPALLAGWTAEAVERALGPINVLPADEENIRQDNIRKAIRAKVRSWRI